MPHDAPPPTLNRSDVQEMVWPPIAAGQAAMLGALLRQLEDSQWMGPEEIAARQRRQLKLLAQHCAKFSPHFARALRKAGLSPARLAEPGGLRRLPVLTRRALQASTDLHCSMAPNSHLPATETSTSGSTGTPVVVRRTAINSLVQCAHVLRSYRWHGRDLAGRACAIRAHAAHVERRDAWGPPASLLFDTGPSLEIPLATDLDEQIGLIDDFAPATVSLSPTHLLALARRCAERGRRLAGVETFWTVAETLTDEVRRETRESLGCAVVDTYSTQELGPIAIQCPQSGLYHVTAEGLIVEVLDERGAPCAVGQAGRVVVTDLVGFATPLVRYDVGDWAEPGPPCPCGRGLPTLAKILGRERNLVRLPDGRRFWPRLGYAGLAAAAPIVQYQLIQTDPGELEAHLVMRRPATPSEEAALTAHLRQVFDWPLQVRFIYRQGEIPRGPGGKFEDFVSRVA